MERNCYFSLRRSFQLIEDRNSLVDWNHLDFVEMSNDDAAADDLIGHTEVENQNNHDLYFHLERHLGNQHTTKATNKKNIDRNRIEILRH